MVSKAHLFGVVLAVAMMAFASGCANCYKTSFKPSSGWFLTCYTLPLKTDCHGQNLRDLRLESTEDYYVYLPYPGIDLAWNEDVSMHGYISHGKRVREAEYAEVEVLTVLGLFGKYSINYYGKPK